MLPAELPGMKHFKGDEWADGFTGCGPIVIDGNPPGEPCLYCRMQFRDGHGNLGYELNSSPGQGQGRLIIEDAVNYVFTRPSQPLPLDVGSWRFDFKTYTTSGPTGTPTTWFVGKLSVED